MKNKFPGTCGCGSKVAKSRGTLVLLDDVFHVRCSKCASIGTEIVVSPSRKTRGKRNGGVSVVRTYRAKSKGGYGRKESKGAFSRRGARKREWIDLTVTGTESLRPDVLANDLGTLIPNPSGAGWLPCSESYAVLVDRRASAAAEGDEKTEFDLLFALAEFKLFGHVGVPVEKYV